MAVALGDTFLTEGRPMNLPEPEAMTRCREEHARLQTVVFSLNQKISQVLAKQEGDFLAAYRAHMYTVQKELQTLRLRVVEAENVLQKNDKVQKLEDECDWYRKEALRLDSFNTAMKKDLKYMKGKLEILEDDRNWLARQLKASKKQDKILRAELGLRTEVTEEPGRAVTAELNDRSGPYSGQGHQMLTGVMGALDRVRREPHTASSPALLQAEPMRMFRGKGTPQYSFRREELPREAIIKRVRNLERKLAKEQRELSRVRATTARTHVERAEMQDFFLRCIEDVKRNICLRKRQGQALHARSAGPWSRHDSNMSTTPQDPEHRVCSLPTSPDCTLSKTTLDEFTPSDRRSVIESLLQREDVTTHLFDMFFPPAGLKATHARAQSATEPETC